jgi:hypothetical protein
MKAEIIADSKIKEVVGSVAAIIGDNGFILSFSNGIGHVKVMKSDQSVVANLSFSCPGCDDFMVNIPGTKQFMKAIGIVGGEFSISSEDSSAFVMKKGRAKTTMYQVDAKHIREVTGPNISSIKLVETHRLEVDLEAYKLLDNASKTDAITTDDVVFSFGPDGGTMKIGADGPGKNSVEVSGLNCSGPSAIRRKILKDNVATMVECISKTGNREFTVVAFESNTNAIKVTAGSLTMVIATTIGEQ